METQKRWRNAEPGTRERVAALLAALRDAFAADAIGLFDDDRAEVGPDGPRSGVGFLDAFDDLDRPCVQVDWDAWYRALRAGGNVETPCACGQHRLLGAMIHGRWALLAVAPVPPRADAALAIASAMSALAACLPPPRVRAGAELDPEGSSEPRAVGAGTPLWWIRRPRE